MLENILEKIAMSDDYGMLKLSSEEAYVLEALGQAYLEGMTEGMIKMAEAMAESAAEEEVDPEEVISAVEEAVESGELSPEEGAEIISELDKVATEKTQTTETPTKKRLRYYNGVKLRTPVLEEFFTKHKDTLMNIIQGKQSYRAAVENLSPREKDQFDALLDAMTRYTQLGIKHNILSRSNFGLDAGYAAMRGQEAVRRMWRHVAKNKTKYGLGAAAVGGAAFLLRDKIFGKRR